MRLIFCIIILIFLIGCQNTTDKKNSNVILAYINSNVEQNKFDIRIYTPPSPPDSMNTSIQGGSIKHDSIIAKLTPLHLYISDSITFDDNFLYRHTDSINEFFFLKDAVNSKKKIYLFEPKHFEKQK